jgi:2-polyprenyl-3-methyl-5-hydroxy-6-metoxy-1,4-benzoquinol methylase
MRLEPTGERVIEEFYRSSPGNYLIYLFHMATYNFARDYVVDKHVLDYGCGSGYGTHHMASCCASIVGVDIAEDAIEYARMNYQATWRMRKSSLLIMRRCHTLTPALIQYYPFRLSNTF